MRHGDAIIRYIGHKEYVFLNVLQECQWNIHLLARKGFRLTHIGKSERIGLTKK